MNSISDKNKFQNQITVGRFQIICEKLLESNQHEKTKKNNILHIMTIIQVNNFTMYHQLYIAIKNPIKSHPVQSLP